jgi:hypothetical protein
MSALSFVGDPCYVPNGHFGIRSAGLHATTEQILLSARHAFLVASAQGAASHYMKVSSSSCDDLGHSALYEKIASIYGMSPLNTYESRISVKEKLKLAIR